MIDTVVLTIPVTRKHIVSPHRFNPDATRLFEAPYYSSYTPCHLNPTTEQKSKGDYYPRLTLSSRPEKGDFKNYLRVEFSAPKIVYGNNFQELNDDNFTEVVSNLKFKLLLMGIRLSDTEIRTASVSAVHYSRNILLEPYVSCTMIINQLEKAGNYNTWLGLQKTVFRNNGHILHFHSDKWEFVIYDKIKDLEQAKKGEKRTVEKDNYSQLNLFQDLNRRQEVIRLELRIGSKQKLSKFLTSIGHGMRMSSITFENVFKNDISKALLITQWKKIKMVNYLPENFQIKSGIIEISTAIRSQYPEIDDNKLMQLTFGIIFITEHGVRAFRNYMHWDKKRVYKWSKFNKILEKVYPVVNASNILSEIESKL